MKKKHYNKQNINKREKNIVVDVEAILKRIEACIADNFLKMYSSPIVA